MAASIPDVIIAGTGAMACLFGARLSAAGVPVTMLGTWAAGLEALQRYGVRVVASDGSQLAYPVRVARQPYEIPPANLALVCVKSWQTERAARQLAGCLTRNGVALTLQNGLGNYETLARLLGPKRSALGTTTFGANMLAPGIVRPGGEGITSLEDHSRLDLFRELFSMAGFAVQTVSDPVELLWGKLVINAAINPLTALLRVPNGELLQKPSTRSLMSVVAREAAAVSAAQGIRLPYPDPVEAAESVAAKTALNLSSMLQDILRGSPTEIDAISGAVVRAAETAGLSVPVNRTLWELVKSLEQADSHQPIPETAITGRLLNRKTQYHPLYPLKTDNRPL
ncbi:MAG: 2-dehydropantoate 2-reductase [Anaerolineales bacterium]|jgi:2-dehydropantoate 2-reductase